VRAVANGDGLGNLVFLLDDFHIGQFICGLEGGVCGFNEFLAKAIL
jgi:hypothetical protein